MMNIFQNSILARLCISMYCIFQKAFQWSFLGKMTAVLYKCYEKSFTKKTWFALCAAINPAPLSLYGKMMRSLGSGLEMVGESTYHSLLYRIIMRIKSFYLRISEGSVVFSNINKLNLHQWMLVAFAFYLPLEYLIRNYIKVPLVISAWEEVFIIAGVFLVLWRRSLKTTSAIERQSPLDIYIILYVSVGFFLMCYVSPYPAIAVEGFRAQMTYIIWFFIIIRLLETDEDFKVAYHAFLCVAAILCIHGIYQYAIAVEIPASWVTKTEMGVRTRVFSITGSPNIFGAFIVMSAPLAAGLIYYSKKVIIKLFYTAVTSIMCLCLLFTFSRGAWVGIMIAIIVFSLYIDKRLLLLLGGVVAFVLATIPSITSRLTFLFTSDYAEASAVGGRALRWETGRMLLLENNPWLGFGLGRFGGAVAMNNQVLEKTEEFEYFYMDNYYLKTMVEMGYAGIIVYLMLIIAFVIWGIRAIHRSGADVPRKDAVEPLVKAVGDYRVLTVSIFSGLSGVLVHCYFENIFEVPYMMAYFWGLASLIMYMGFFRQRLPSK